MLLFLDRVWNILNSAMGTRKLRASGVGNAVVRRVVNSGGRGDEARREEREETRGDERLEQ
jgi:hypothetical protein